MAGWFRVVDCSFPPSLLPSGRGNPALGSPPLGFLFFLIGKEEKEREEKDVYTSVEGERGRARERERDSKRKVW